MLVYQASRPNETYWYHINSVRNISLHWHEFFELELTLDGHGTQTVNTSELDCRRGSFVLLSPRDFHRLTCRSEERLQLYGIGFTEELLSPDLLQLMSKYPPPYYLQTGEGEDFDELQRRIVELQQTIDRTDELRDPTVKRRIELLLLYVIELLKSRGNSVETDAVDKNYAEVLQPVLLYINQHYGEPIRREELAELVHLSPGYLSNLFKKQLGISISDYLLDCRMRNARVLLLHSSESVRSIIEKVGYSSPSLFYRKFYEYYGVTPSELVRRKSKK